MAHFQKGLSLDGRGVTLTPLAPEKRVPLLGLF
jgi:hypothetical protein